MICPCASAGPAAPCHGTGTQRRGGMRRLEGDAGLQQPGNEVPQGRKGDGKGVSGSKGGKGAPGAKPPRSPVCTALQPAVPAGPAVVPRIPKGSPSPCSPQMHTRSPQISHSTAQAPLWIPFAHPEPEAGTFTCTAATHRCRGEGGTPRSRGAAGGWTRWRSSKQQRGTEALSSSPFHLLGRGDAPVMPPQPGEERGSTAEPPRCPRSALPGIISAASHSEALICFPPACQSPLLERGLGNTLCGVPLPPARQHGAGGPAGLSPLWGQALWHGQEPAAASPGHRGVPAPHTGGFGASDPKTSPCCLPIAAPSPPQG